MSLPKQCICRLLGVFTLASALFFTPITKKAFAQASLLDPTFKAGSGANGRVHSLIVQDDGKIIIGGEFTQIAGHARANLARLNSDGQLDITFPQGADGPVYQLLKQADGKILVGGNFTNLQGVARQRVGRLLTNGIVDGSFDVGTNVPLEIVRVLLACQTDGKLLVGRSYSYNESSSFLLKRFNLDGQLDNTFVQTNFFTNGLSAICVRSNGSILLGGYFPQLSNASPVYLSLLDTNGVVDMSFISPVGRSFTGWFGGVFCLLEEPGGSVLVGGWFSRVGSTNSISLVRLTPSLEYDAGFQPDKVGHSLNVVGDYVNSCIRQSDGKLVLGGNFMMTGPPDDADAFDRVRLNLVRLDSQGKVDPCFDPELTIGGVANAGAVYCLAQQPDGRIIAGGYFDCYSGGSVEKITSYNLARFLPQGDCNATRVHLRFYPDTFRSYVWLAATCAPGGTNHLQVSTNLVNWTDMDDSLYKVVSPFPYLEGLSWDFANDLPLDISTVKGGRFYRIKKEY